MTDNMCRWLANRLPKRVVYYAALRVWLYGTSGPYSEQEVPALHIDAAVRRWSKSL